MQDNQENLEIRGGVAVYTMIRLPSASADSIKSLCSILILSYVFITYVRVRYIGWKLQLSVPKPEKEFLCNKRPHNSAVILQIQSVTHFKLHEIDKQEKCYILQYVHNTKVWRDSKSMLIVV